MARTQATQDQDRTDSSSNLIFEFGETVDRSCELSNLIQKYPSILGYFTDSDCANGANQYTKDGKDNYYYLCDYHMGQMYRGHYVQYTQNDPNASWNLPK